MGTLLASAASAIAVVAVFGALFGWQASEVYFTALGAEWVVPLLSPAQRLAIAAFPVGALTLSLAFWPSVVVTRESATRGRRFGPDWVLAALALIGLVVHYGFGTRAGVYSAVGLVAGSVGVFCWTLDVGFTVVQAAYRVAAEGMRSLVRPSVIYYVVLVGFLQIPNLWGDVRASADRTPNLTSLPVVDFGGNRRDWHLLTVIGENAVLMKVPAEPRHGEVRLVPFSQLGIVQMPKR
jgi:hypothetical protein